MDLLLTEEEIEKLARDYPLEDFSFIDDYRPEFTTLQEALIDKLKRMGMLVEEYTPEEMTSVKLPQVVGKGGEANDEPAEDKELEGKIAIRLHTIERNIIRIVEETSPINCKWEKLSEYLKDQYLVQAIQILQEIARAGYRKEKHEADKVEPV